MTGDNTTGAVDTSGLNPGNYTVTGHVSEGQKAGQFADCTANFTVKQFDPPTISCSANPTTVQPGGTATITAQGVSPQNRPLTYTYSASAGQISGTRQHCHAEHHGCACRSDHHHLQRAGRQGSNGYSQRLRSMWKRRRHRRCPRRRRSARSTSIGTSGVRLGSTTRRRLAWMTCSEPATANGCHRCGGWRSGFR